ncbi:hypothetical protein, conserved [Eimeria necatrix]|uniref:Uncharacterized protein n=1 Tax=Eimeria necatrix TaxID=51315 RepID=U6MU65_9EIME|nr:hypothetical protein, conserved [Eimeria necatrix]CDJ66613.1 hypothetical protein, conserved [Eimeria necatrix]
MTAGADGEGHEALLNGVGQGEDGNDAADLPASDGEVMPSAATHAAEDEGPQLHTSSAGQAHDSTLKQERSSERGTVGLISDNEDIELAAVVGANGQQHAVRGDQIEAAASHNMKRAKFDGVLSSEKAMVAENAASKGEQLQLSTQAQSPHGPLTTAAKEEQPQAAHDIEGEAGTGNTEDCAQSVDSRCRKDLDRSQEYAVPFGTTAGTFTSFKNTSAVALASEAAAALLSAATENAVAAIETGWKPSRAPEGLTLTPDRRTQNAGEPCSASANPSSLEIFVEERRFPDATKLNDLPAGLPSAEKGVPASEEEKAELPAFADEENVALYNEIREKQQLLSQRGTDIGQKAERIMLMQQHLQQLKVEALDLEKLAAAKEAHISSDKRMEGIAIRQASKLKSEIQHQQQHQLQLQARLTGLQIEISRGQEQIDCFKLQMKWNEEELAQWRSAAHQKEEDLACIAEFKKKDDMRAAKLMAQTEKISVEVAEAKKRLKEEQTAARAARAELQRSLEYFAEQQKDRALLIAQGEATMEEMWRSDARIARSTHSFEETQRRLTQQMEKLMAARGFATRQQNQNKSLLGEVTSLEQQLALCRSNYASAAMAVGQLTEEVAGLRGQLSAASTRGKTAKVQLVELHESLADQKQRLEVANKKKEAAEKKLAKEQENVRSAGEAGEAREAFHAQVAARLQKLQQRVKASRDTHFGVAQKLAEEKAALKMQRGALSSSKSALKSLHAQLQQHEAEKSRQQELLYSIDFQCQAMQRKVSRVSGYKTAAETKALQKQIKELQAELAIQQEEHSMLSTQVRHLDSELRKAYQSFAKADEEDSRCANSVGDIRLACASLDRELQTVIKEKEELVLAESLRKLERAAEEERRRIAREAAERRSKISALEARYENLVQSGQTTDGGGHSQAYYVIRVGQEREELQRKGAELHRRLQNATSEVQGLEASLRDVSLSNGRLRTKLQQESRILSVLQEKKAEKEGALFFRNHVVFAQQQQIGVLKDSLEREQRCLHQTKQIHQGVIEKLREADEKMRSLEKERLTVDEKLRRSQQLRQKLQASIQKRRLAADKTDQSTDSIHGGEFCNAEIHFHAECLKGMLQSLYRTMGVISMYLAPHAKRDTHWFHDVSAEYILAVT